MNNQFVFTSGYTEKHEFLRFNHQPTNKDFLNDLQMWCRDLARRADLTRMGWAEDRLDLNMTIAVDGRSYSSQVITDLYLGIHALEAAKSFRIDVKMSGQEGAFTLRRIQDEDKAVLDYTALSVGPTLEELASQAMESEQFIYKCIEFLPDSGAIHCAMIENGEFVDLASRMSSDILQDKRGEWWSWQLLLGASFPEDHPEIGEKLKEIVRRSLPADELKNVEAGWEESKNNNEPYVAILYGTQWIGDLKPLEDYLCEVSEVFPNCNDICYGDDSSNTLIDSDNFGAAKIVVDESGAHVVGVYF